MKEKVKIWSRRRLLGAFLAFLGLSAVATAQDRWTIAGHNGTENAKCADPEDAMVLEVTKTVEQMREGTDILLKFTTPSVIGDKFYLVAAEGGGALTQVAGCPSYGDNLQVGGFTGTDDAWEVAADAQLGTTIVAEGNKIWVKATNDIDGSDVEYPVVYQLGIYIQDVAAYTPNGGETVDPTSCYSDVYYIKINVLPNIYASLTLNGDANEEYICHNGTTQTNLGFSLCHLPAGGTLNYTVTATNDDGRGVAGNAQVATTGTGGSNAVGLTAGTPQTFSLAIATANLIEGNKYTLKIGQQQLVNNNADVVADLTYTFTDMEYVYMDGTREIRLPIIFETAENNCNGNENASPESFTVHVAPNFEVKALAYSAERTTDGYQPGTLTGTSETLNPTFCQGTIAYLFGETSAEEGTTAYAWANTVGAANTTNLTAGSGGIQNSHTAELTVPSVADAPAYSLTLTGTWNDDESHYYRTEGGNRLPGCITTDDMPIKVTAAPILLLATDETVKGDDSWNSTNVITAPEVCPGNQIYIKTTATGDVVLDGTDRNDHMMAGNYIKHNNNNITWTVSYESGTSAYTDWRNTTAQTSGTIAHDIDNDDVAHYLDNNGGANPANVIYTVYSSGSCQLVKSNGMPLTYTITVDEQPKKAVQIKYPVSTRPTFQLGNMFN